MDNITQKMEEGSGIPEGLERLRRILSLLPARLAALSDEEVSRKPAPDKWSAKEELGHLIDSAANNLQRIVRAQIEDKLALPGYDGDEWVRVHAYHERDWNELISLWRAGNRQMVAAAEAAPESSWSNTCTIGGSEPLTLRFVLDDYVDHMLDHLQHIGIDADDLFAPQGKQDSLYPEKPAEPARPINELMKRRWSPRAFEEGRAVEPEKIMALLEAARWAPSCFNEQPWRYLIFDGSDPEAMERARGCLAEGNAWALKAPLLMLSVARENFTRNEKPNRTAQHDVGLASENLVLEAIEMGLAAHQMAGFDTDRALSEFSIPEGFTPMAMIAIGYPYWGDIDELPETLKEKELAGRSRKQVSEIAFAGKWGEPYGD